MRKHLIGITNPHLTPKLFFNYVIKNKTNLAEKKFSAYQGKKLSRKDLIDLELDFLFQSFGSQASYLYQGYKGEIWLHCYSNNYLSLSLSSASKIKEILKMHFKLKALHRSFGLSKDILQALNLEHLTYFDTFRFSSIKPKNQFQILVFDEQKHLGSYFFNIDFSCILLLIEPTKKEIYCQRLEYWYPISHHQLKSLNAQHLSRFLGEEIELFLGGN